MVAERAGRERPAIRQDRKNPGWIVSLRQFVGMERRGRERSAAISELRDGERAMDRFSARGFASRDPSERSREDKPERRPLVGGSKDAGSARQAAPSQDVGRVGTDPRLLDRVPDQAFGPVMDRAPMIDRTREGRCAMRLERREACTRGTFLGAFPVMTSVWPSRKRG